MNGGFNQVLKSGSDMGDHLRYTEIKRVRSHRGGIELTWILVTDEWDS
jgi:hypothetical protein